MACREIAALRIGLMKVLGIDDAAELRHELNELAEAAEQDGPLKSLCDAGDLKTLQRHYESALTGLEERIAGCTIGAPELPYYRSLLIMTKKTELALGNHLRALEQFYADLDEIHHFVHEIYPAE